MKLITRPKPALCPVCLSGARERGRPTAEVFPNGHIRAPLTTPHLDEWPAHQGTRTYCDLPIRGMGYSTSYWMRRG
jgi:hypothetical protein